MRQALSLNTVVVAIKNQVSSNLGEEAVILHLGKGAYYGVNEVGALIWSLLLKPVKVSDIAAEVAGKYQVSRKQCQADLLQLLDKMLRARLIETKEETS